MKIILFIFLIVMSLGIGHFVGAEADPAKVYVPIVGIPGLDPNTQTTEMYVQALYRLAIIVAAFLAVVKIIFGGVKWMLSDVVTDKSSAKKDIQGAVFGLLIVLSAVLILETINPDLLKLNILQNAPPISISLQKHSEKTACDIDINSPNCCRSKGGSYFQEVVNGNITSRCNMGEEVPLSPTGDTEQDKIKCTSSGLNWDSTNNKCTTKSIQELPLPLGSDGLVPSVACSNYGLYWEYRAETNTCINKT